MLYLLVLVAFVLGVGLGYLFAPKEQKIYHYHNAKDPEIKEEKEYNPSYVDQDYKQWLDLVNK